MLIINIVTVLALYNIYLYCCSAAIIETCAAAVLALYNIYLYCCSAAIIETCAAAVLALYNIYLYCCSMALYVRARAPVHFIILYRKIMMLPTLGAKLLLLTSFNLKPQSMSKIMRKFAYQN